MLLTDNVAEKEMKEFLKYFQHFSNGRLTNKVSHMFIYNITEDDQKKTISLLESYLKDITVGVLYKIVSS